MSYDVVRLVRQLIDSGIGDISRLSYILERLENGKYLYLSDQKYLENLLSVNENIVNKITFTKPPKFENLETELRNINTQLEKILQNKARNERKITDNTHTNIDTTSASSSIKNNTVKPKSEDTALLLSVVLGLISLQGIGHIYIQKITKGLAILTASLIFSSISILYFLGIMREWIPVFLHHYFIPLLIGGYFGLYAFQTLDARRLCASYNAYVSTHKEKPPWW